MNLDERLERMQEALDATRGKDKPSRVEYCLECDEWESDPAVDWDEGHWKHHVAADYDETELAGWVQALEWVKNNVLDTDREGDL